MWRLLAFILPVIRLYFIGVKVLIDQLLHKSFTLPVLPRQNGRVAIVTGGARGMGYETSRHLASLGTHVVIAGNEEEEGLTAVKKIQKESGHRKVEFMYLDLSSLKSVRQFVQRFKARGLPLHTLVNNGTRPFLLITAEGQTHLYRPIEGLMMRKGHCLTPESLISGTEAIWLDYPALAVHNGTLHKVVSSELKHQGRKVWVKVNMACSDLDTLSLCHNRVKKTVNTFSERAGVMLVPERKTEDGFELHFGLNYLGHFLLTNLLLEVLRDSGQSGRCSRIITVSSATHYGGRLDLNDLQGRSCYCSHGAYSQSKLALVLFTYHLQEQLWARGDPVTANAVDPGMVDTDLYQNLCSPAQLAKKPVAKLFFRTPAEGASTAIYAAAATELEGLGGLYLYNGQKKISSASSYEKQLQEKLWTKSCAMVGLQKA